MVGFSHFDHTLKAGFDSLLRHMDCDKTYYDDLYRKSVTNGGQYGLAPELTAYYPMWKRAISLISTERIVDLGCGVGQVAMMLIDNNKKLVAAYDFSEYAIALAKKNLPDHAYKFKQADLMDGVEDNYDTALCFEVLEHLKDDLAFIDTIPVGKKFIFSVPNFIVTGHYRYFTDEAAIAARYGSRLRINAIWKYELSKTKLRSAFLCEAVRR